MYCLIWNCVLYKSVDVCTLYACFWLSPGGVDNYGHPILTVPRHNTAKTLPRNGGHFVALTRHYHALCADTVSYRKGLAFLADFRGWSKETIIAFVEALDRLQVNEGIYTLPNCNMGNIWAINSDLVHLYVTTYSIVKLHILEVHKTTPE